MRKLYTTTKKFLFWCDTSVGWCHFLSLPWSFWSPLVCGWAHNTRAAPCEMAAEWRLHSTVGHYCRDKKTCELSVCHFDSKLKAKWPFFPPSFSHPSLYLMTASTIFFIFLVRESGLGESFSAGGRPRFFAFLTSSSLSRPRPLLELGVAGPPSWSRSLLRFLVVFLWRTSSSMSSRFPSSIACDEEKSIQIETDDVKCKFSVSSHN